MRNFSPFFGKGSSVILVRDGIENNIQQRTWTHGNNSDIEDGVLGNCPQNNTRQMTWQKRGHNFALLHLGRFIITLYILKYCLLF